MGEAKGQPTMRHGPIIEWSPGTLIADANDDINELAEATAALDDYNSEDDSDYEDDNSTDSEDNNDADD